MKEQDHKWHCLYCNHELSDHDWKSHWEGEIHYKSTVCQCGKKQMVKVDFFGSGHDNWDKQVNFIFDDGKIKIEQPKKEEVKKKILEDLTRMDRT